MFSHNLPSRSLQTNAGVAPFVTHGFEYLPTPDVIYIYSVKLCSDNKKYLFHRKIVTWIIILKLTVEKHSNENRFVYIHRSKRYSMKSYFFIACSPYALTYINFFTLTKDTFLLFGSVK